MPQLKETIYIYNDWLGKPIPNKYDLKAFATFVF